MKTKFKWRMSEKEYNRLKNIVCNGVFNNYNIYFGCVEVGNLCVEINHTLDKKDFYGFSSGYMTGSEYQDGGRHYGAVNVSQNNFFSYEQCETLDNINIDNAIKNTANFNEFKKYIEDEIEKIITLNPKLKEKSECKNTYWEKRKECEK